MTKDGGNIKRELVGMGLDKVVTSVIIRNSNYI